MQNNRYPMQNLNLSDIAIMTISLDERAFFAELGTRMAQLRKEQGITQVQMAEALGVSQQTINSYEVARRRVPVSALPILAQLFGVGVDELLGIKNGAAKRGPTPMLQRQIERLSQLPRAKQKVVMEMLNGVLG